MPPELQDAIDALLRNAFAPSLSSLKDWPESIWLPALLDAVDTHEGFVPSRLITALLPRSSDPTVTVRLLCRSVPRREHWTYLEANIAALSSAFMALADVRLETLEDVDDEDALLRPHRQEARVLGPALGLAFREMGQPLPARYDLFLRQACRKDPQRDGNRAGDDRLVEILRGVLDDLPLGRRAHILTSKGPRSWTIAWDLIVETKTFHPLVADRAVAMFADLTDHAAFEGRQVGARMRDAHRMVFAGLGAMAVPPLQQAVLEEPGNIDLVRALGATACPEAIEPLIEMLDQNDVAADALRSLLNAGYIADLQAAIAEKVQISPGIALELIRLIPLDADRAPLMAALRSRTADPSILARLKLLDREMSPGQALWRTIKAHPEGAEWKHALDLIIREAPYAWQQVMFDEMEHWSEARRLLSVVYLFSHSQHDSVEGANRLMKRSGLPGRVRAALPWGLLDEPNDVRYPQELLNRLTFSARWLGRPPFEAIRDLMLRGHRHRAVVFDYLEAHPPQLSFTELFIQGLVDPVQAIRDRCVETLWRLGPQTAPLLAEALKRDEPQLISGVASVLAIFGDPGTLGPIDDALARPLPPGARRCLEVARGRCALSEPVG